MHSSEKERRGLDYISPTAFLLFLAKLSQKEKLKLKNIRKLSDFGGFQSTEMRDFFF
jgi:hypothetical protein